MHSIYNVFKYVQQILSFSSTYLSSYVNFGHLGLSFALLYISQDVNLLIVE